MKHKPTENSQASEDTQSSPTSIAPGEIIIGVLAGFDAQGQALVDFAENTSQHALPAMSTVSLTQKQVGRELALLFANGDLASPVIIGAIHSPLQDMLENFSESPAEEDTAVTLESQQGLDNVRVDGKRIVFDAKEEIVLQCGASSITLTKAGKILIRGKYLLSRSSGVNRIQGGSVQVN